jgi:hypothetical protein
MHLSPAATSVMKLSETLGVVLWNRIATLATEVRSNPAEKTVLGAAVRALKVNIDTVNCGGRIEFTPRVLAVDHCPEKVNGD